MEDEKFSDEFQCCVCLSRNKVLRLVDNEKQPPMGYIYEAMDRAKEAIQEAFNFNLERELLYKPVVLACGHISCFWCVFGAMDTWKKSCCPICRHPFNHFPNICELLHYLLLKLYPINYKRREQEVIEEEKKLELFSPQFDNFLSTSQPSEELDIQVGMSPNSSASPCNKLTLGSCSAETREHSLVDNSSNSTIVSHRGDSVLIPSISTYEATKSETVTQSCMPHNELVQQNSRQVLITDLLCALCKELLHRPVVLNCGHVFCEACTLNQGDNGPSCQVCRRVNPNGHPKVCLVLEHFLEENFSKQYALRKTAAFKQVGSKCGSPPYSTQAQKHSSRLASLHADDPWLCGPRSKVHMGVGCDYCGMYPIIGERYKCKDCKEKAGFDLCEGCYNSSSKLPGRFNQNHTPVHRLEKVQGNDWVRGGASLLEAGSFEDDDSDAVEYVVDVHPPSNFWPGEAEDFEEDDYVLEHMEDEDNYGLEDMEDVHPSHISAVDAPQNDVGAGASISSDSALEDGEEATHSTI